MAGGSEPLHTSHVDQPMATINRLLILTHAALTTAVLYYRASGLASQTAGWPLVSWSLLLAAELLLAFLWTLRQAFKWRPVARAAFPERLQSERHLPPVDVFVCTADPEMEPTMEVMNTLISAACLDYPAERLSVYLSDDGGSALTLHAARKAYAFAAPWRAFCRRFDVETRCPEAYFSAVGSDRSASADEEFLEVQQRLKLMYESLKESVDNAKIMSKTTHGSTAKGQDRPSHIEVIQDAQEQEEMPLLVYVSREKQNRIPHHYKAGALNVLLRVSSVMSNSPYVLVLDCDMYCNNPTSARQAMCFHLEPRLAPSLAFVQFPQRFHNISKDDIYCAELGFLFKRLWKGCDGLRGPILSGTGFYIKRDAVYGAKPGNTTIEELASSDDISKIKQLFGSSNELIASLRLRPNLRSNIEKHTVTSEATILASCAYELDTQWGEQANRILVRFSRRRLLHRVSPALPRMDFGLLLPHKACVSWQRAG
ncbi:cellulose synthase-like protein G2 [Iris pallida]|uniref:Cellulose synthase-like protein G2 n=1 Tax=Iris pallida TaxID=29817 RepID=A0AAX6HR94_IRIPA|nr:cellulose synthase-like protein G2 [Iris pallida]